MIKRRSDGRYDVNLDDDSREVLTLLLADLSSQLDTGPDHPNLDRLSPPAYLDDDEADAGYQLLAGEELRTSRQASIATVIDSLTRTEVTEPELWDWIQALNAVRLVVGTRLEIDDDDHGPLHRPSRGPQDDALWAVYDFTTIVQHEVVAALDDRVPDPPDPPS
ncbi:DUF2017 family protein [Aquihabitans sp. McL0605]|uniref:DUF2017 family protein n=1 Tax=Aquihabitans sp. McL0605 TaxID=3415671 RepID=UPI003CF706C5